MSRLQVEIQAVIAEHIGRAETVDVSATVAGLARTIGDLIGAVDTEKERVKLLLTVRNAIDASMTAAKAPMTVGSVH